MGVYFLRLLSLGLLVSGLSHLLAPVRTEQLMSQPRHVRAAGAVMLAMVVPSIVFRFYLLGSLLAAFGLPRVVVPERSIRLQQWLYPRRVHGVLLVAGAAGLWALSSHG